MDFEELLFFDDPQIGDDNQLQQSTHRCPRTGEYCTPECAWAFVHEDADGIDCWMCGQALSFVQSECKVGPQTISWKEGFDAKESSSIRSSRSYRGSNDR
jgi:hypothetical protein